LESPGDRWMVKYAVLPPSFRSFLHALSTESLGLSQHNTSVWTMVSVGTEALFRELVPDRE